MSGEKLQELFLEAVKSLNLKFPVAKIAKDTGYATPIVSEYLRGKKLVSEKFFKKFCDVYQFSYEYLVGTASQKPVSTSKGDKNDDSQAHSGADELNSSPTKNDDITVKGILELALKYAETQRLDAEARLHDAIVRERLTAMLEGRNEMEGISGKLKAG